MANNPNTPQWIRKLIAGFLVLWLISLALPPLGDAVGTGGDAFGRAISAGARAFNQWGDSARQPAIDLVNQVKNAVKRK